jgi:similar to stage IV sporulation protein
MISDFCTGFLDFVTIRVEGGSRERFLNLCRNKGVFLKNMKLCGEVLECTLRRSQFGELRPICQICGCRVKIVKKQGMRYIAFKYRKHYSFLIGILLAALIIRGINLYLWDIALNGNSLYSDQYIDNYLTSIGIRTCMRLDLIDCNWLESKIRADFDGVTWVSVSKSGTRLTISIKENDGVVETAEEQTYSNIYAGADGTVETIIVRSGTPQVKKGDTVSEGQLLVSGEIVIADAYGVEMAVLQTNADADIYIRTTIDYNDCIYRDYRQKEYTGVTRTTYIADAFGKEITIFNHRTDDDWDLSNETLDVVLFGKIALPIKLNIVKYNQYVINDKLYTDDEMTELLREKFDLYIKNLQNGVQILDNDVKISGEGDCFRMTGTISVVAPYVRFEAEVSEAD